jgi:hypothetical protein
MDTLPDSRLDPADVDFIKELIKKNFRFFSVFYDEAHAKMKSLPKEKNDYVPKDVETVKDGYKKAFTQKRSLPPLYWKALAVLLSITPDNLPSRAEAVNEAPAPTQQLADMPPRGGKSFADWFSELSARQIVTYIGTMGFVPKKNIALLHQEFLDPQCLSILTIKLVHGPIDCLVRLYYTVGLGVSRKQDTYRVLNAAMEFTSRRDEPILGAVSAAIGVDPTLRIEHAKKVARSGFKDLLQWFQFVACYFDPVLFYDLDQAFMQFATEPTFRMNYDRPDWQLVRALMKGFDKCGCDGAVQVLTDLCFEEDYRRSIEADPEDFKEFFAGFRGGENKAKLREFLRRANQAPKPPPKE